MNRLRLHARRAPIRTARSWNRFGQILLSAAVAVSATAASAVETTLSANARIFVLREAARTASEKKDWPSALASYDEILRSSPNDAQSLLGKANILHSELKRPRDAVEPLTLATRALPASPTAWANLCWALIDAGEFQATLAICEQGARLAPEAFSTYVNLGHAHLFLGQDEVALKRYREALRLVPDDQTFEKSVLADFERFAERGWRRDTLSGMKLAVQELWIAEKDAARASGGRRLGVLLREVLEQDSEAYFRQNKDTIMALVDEARGDPQLGDLAEYLRYMMTLVAGMSSIKAEDLVASASAVRLMVEKRYGSPHPLLESVDAAESLGAMARGDYAAAERAELRALHMSIQVHGEHDRETLSKLGSLASTYQLAGKLELEAQTCQRQIDIAENVTGPDSIETLEGLRCLAEALSGSERYDAALTLQPRISRLVARLYPAESKEAIKAMITEADLYTEIDSFDLAEPLLIRARALSEQSFGPESVIATEVVEALVKIYRRMGAFEKALPLIERSLAITGTSKVRYENLPNGAMKDELQAMQSEGVSSLMGLYQNQGRYDEAMLASERAIHHFESLMGPQHPLVLAIKVRKGWLHLDLEQYDAAAALMESLLRRPAGAAPLLGRSLEIALSIQARANLARGDAEAAFLTATQLVTMQEQSSQSPMARAGARFLMARAERVRGHGELAVFHAKLAINEIQGIRARMTRLEQDLQQGIVQQAESCYQELAAWLIEDGRIAEAEQVLAMLKDREFFQLTRGNNAEPASRRAGFVGAAEQQAIEDQEKLAARTVGRARSLEELERRNKQGELSPEERALRRQLLDEALVWRAEYQRYLASLAGRFGKAGRENASLNAADLHSRLQENVAKDRDGAVGLHYVVVDDRIAIIVATPNGVFGRSSKISKKQLNARIGEFRRAITDRRDTGPAARALWRILIAPVEADIRASGAKTLVLSLTDALRYVPFAALEDDKGHYLVESYALSLWAGAASVDPVSNKGEWRVSAMGLTKSRQGFNALPAVRSELESIVQVPGSRGVLPGQIALDEQFNRDQLDVALSGKANVVHIASHFEFHPGSERSSVLLLGSGAPLTLGQLSVMDFSSVDQLTLSACNTATGGGVNENGAEVEGLAAAVLRGRAKAVLGTLWQVSDDSTADFMYRFYAQRVQSEPVSRAQALRTAQLALLRPNPTQQVAGTQPATAAERARTSWTHPYYWAPFVLSGNWL